GATARLPIRPAADDKDEAGPAARLGKAQLYNPSERPLSEHGRAELSKLLAGLTTKRQSIAEAMVWCLEHAESALEIVDSIASAVTTETEVEPEQRRLSALFLASDLLHTLGSIPHNRALIQPRMPRVFAPRLGVCLQAVKHRQPASSVIRAWSEWALYQPDYLMRLNNAFLGLLVPDQQQQQQLLESVSAPAGELEKDPSASRSPAAAASATSTVSRFCRASRDYDGDPLDVDGQPLALSGGGGFTRVEMGGSGRLRRQAAAASRPGTAFPTLSTAMRLLVLSLFCLSLAAPRLAQPPPPTAQCVADAYPPPPDTLVPNRSRQSGRTAGHPDGARLWRPARRRNARLLGQFRQFLFNLTGSDSLMNIVDKGDVSWPRVGPVNLSLGEVTLFNVFYELFPLCTSILAEDSSGRLFPRQEHGLRAVSGAGMQGVFLSRSHYAPGYIGVLTGLRPHPVQPVVNSRVSAKTQSLAGVVEWLLGIRDQYWLGVCQLELERHRLWPGQAARLANWKLIAPVYFILDGAKHLERLDGDHPATEERPAPRTSGSGPRLATTAGTCCRPTMITGNLPQSIDNRRGPAMPAWLRRAKDEAASFWLTVYTALMREWTMPPWWRTGVSALTPAHL
uniref:CID domain-containing protein n=1 Tax=Macrostomum lignano TaxID=282301 RepID=A0A1I8FB98_9PLAT